MATYNQHLYTESVSAVTATNTVELGDRRWVNGREYTYVYNAGKTQAVNHLVFLSGTSGYSVVATFTSLTTTANNVCVFGVVREAELTAGYYGWVVTRGFCSLTNDGTYVVAAGDMLIPSLDGKVRPYSAVSVVTNLVYMAMGNTMKAMAATDTAATLAAYVRLG